VSTITTERPALLTQRQAAEFLGIHRHTFAQLVAAGSLEPVRIPGMRRLRYRRVDVEELANGVRAP
jgi:excisionase family DNA binding protein